MANIGGFRGNGITLYIAGDTTGLDRALKKATNDVNTFARNTEKANAKASAASGAVAGGFFGRGGKGNQGLRGLASGTGLGSAALFGSGAFIGAALSAAAIKKSLDAASDLNEQITKTNQVFKQSAKTIQDWSTTTAKSIGISREAALEAASTFGNLFSAQGFGNIQNSQLSKGLVQLAADLASFNNIDPTQVLEDLRSGIVGEIEPVRKYGADLRIARVQQEALAESGKNNVKQLSQQELTLARIHLLYKDTSAAQGDFARTSGGLANQERILRAQTEDLAAKLGNLLLPAAKDLVTTLNGIATLAGQAADGLNKLANVKIPPIHIPFIFDQGDGTSLGFLFDKATLTLGEFVDLTEKQVQKTIDDFRGSTEKAAQAATPKASTDLTRVYSGFLLNVLHGVKLPGDVIADGIDNALGFFKKKLQEGIGKTKTSINIGNLIDNLQLGVEKSQVSGSLQTQLQALISLKAGIQKQIAAGVDVKNAQHALVAVESQIAGLQQQIKEEGISKILSNLQLGVDKAALTKGLGDDLKALEAQRDGLRAQIKAGNDVASNASQLVTVLGNIKSVREQIQQNAKEALTASAFKQIGLSATGGEIIPGVANLKKQLEQLNSRDLSDVPKKLANRLAGVGKVLADPIKSSIPEVRSAINDLFKAIRGEFDKNSGPLTKTTSLNTNKILKGLGLDPAAAKELRGRLSKFNSAGIALAGSGVAATRGGFPVGATAPVVNVNVELDGKQVAKSVTVNQQQRSRRNPRQKRGPTVHNI